MISFAILTLGCKVNSYESEAVINDLLAHGWINKKFEDVCDVYIVNTCTVTSTSDQKSRQMLHAARRTNPNAVVVAMGCFVQLNPSQALEIADVIIGTANRLQTYSLVLSYLETKKQINAVTDVLADVPFEEMKVNVLKTHTRAFIKIQDGCQNYCSYCAIPYSRGKIRSRNDNNVIAEIKNLTEKGTKEVILAGINTGTYGFDLGYINLAGLIKRIMEETVLYRLRLSSIELMEITDELLGVIKKYEKRIAMHFHIPIQAASDPVLKRMNRKYDLATYEAKIKQIRSLFPNAAITTDMLVGFVGETEEEFNDAVSFVKKIGFAEMHIFPYSKRKGTKAYDMEGHIDEKVKKERTKEMLAVAAILKENYMSNFIGTDMEVLAETKKIGYWYGHTSNYLEVKWEADELLMNKICLIHLDSIDNGKLKGTMKGVKDE